MTLNIIVMLWKIIIWININTGFSIRRFLVSLLLPSQYGRYSPRVVQVMRNLKVRLARIKSNKNKIIQSNIRKCLFKMTLHNFYFLFFISVFLDGYRTFLINKTIVKPINGITNVHWRSNASKKYIHKVNKLRL